MFLNRFRQTVDFFDPNWVLPFAGQYYLGGGLRVLNKFRGTADPIETLRVSNKVVI